MRGDVLRGKIMKKIIKLVCVLFLLMMGVIGTISTVNAQESILKVVKDEGYEISSSDTPKASLVVSIANGEILWQENPDRAVDPASLSKLMTIFIVYDAIKEGKISLSDKVVPTATDEAISKITALSNVPLTAGVEYPVEELVKMALLPSSNAATILLSHLVNDNSDEFVDLMNQKAKELGMTNTKFEGATGAVAEDFQGHYTVKRHSMNQPNQTTARDLAKMVIALYKSHPEITQYTRNSTLTVMSGTPYAQTIKNTNHSVQGDLLAYTGIIGLKTGTSERDGFNYIGIYQKDGVELLDIVLGVSEWTSAAGEYNRHKIGNALLSYVLKQYEAQTLFNPGIQTIHGQKVKLDHAVKVFTEKGKAATYQIEGNQLKVATPQGTIYEQELTFSVEKEPDEAVESTYEETTTEASQWIPKIIWNKTVHFIKKLPLLFWVFFFGVVLVFYVLRKFLKTSSKRNHRR